MKLNILPRLSCLLSCIMFACTVEVEKPSALPENMQLEVVGLSGDSAYLFKTPEEVEKAIEKHKSVMIEALEKQLYTSQPLLTTNSNLRTGSYSVNRAIGPDVFNQHGPDFYKIVYNGDDFGEIRVEISFDWCLEAEGNGGTSGKSPIFTKVYPPHVEPRGLNGTTVSGMYGTEAQIADAFGKSIKFSIPVRLSFAMELDRETALSYGAELFGATISKGVKVVFRTTEQVMLKGRFHIRDVMREELIDISDADCYASLDDINLKPSTYPAPTPGSGGGSGGSNKGGGSGGGDDGSYGNSGGTKGGGFSDPGDGGTASGGSGGTAGTNNGGSDGGGDTNDQGTGIEIIIVIEDSTPVIA